MSKKDPKTGVYEGYVEFKNPSPPPPWIAKRGNQGWSTFWPDDMQAWKVDKATSDAFQSAYRKQDGKWEGMYGDIRVEGWYDRATGNIGHGWPKL
jgi:hypothetical protein